MRSKLFTKVNVLMMVLMIMVMPIVNAASVEEKRDSVRSMAEETLNRLYKVHPAARGAIEHSAGYAVFNSYGVKLFLFGGGRGKGIAVNRQRGEEIFMKMAEIGAGLGLGVKKYSSIFVFENQKAFQKFVSQGWQFGGQATLAATDGVAGGAFQGAVAIWPGAWLYQLTDKGLAVEITGEGNRYYKDSELN